MVEGHSVHRVATMHRQRLVGKAFHAMSPNGRFTDGAKAIDGKQFYRIEAVGKNLFAFFKFPNEIEDKAVVVHVHFGMAGNWAVYQGHEEEVPEPTGTNRLRLTHAKEAITADLSAMTVNQGGMELYEKKRAALGHDPLRDDANPDVLWSRVRASKKSIGALIMDQSFFTGPGNIYRAEILFKAGVHPDVPGKALEREEFDLIWKHTVSLLQRGYQTGSILTVDPDEAKQLGNPKLRRYIYNTSHCPRCQTTIQVWDIASRTCYACPKCQPKRTVAMVDSTSAGKEKTKRGRTAGKVAVTPQKDCVPFNSHCARESAETRLREGGPDRLTAQEIKDQLIKLGMNSIPKGTRKASLVKLLLEQQQLVASPTTASSNGTVKITSSEAAAVEKALAHESLAVEHIAELAPGQARRARAKAQKTTTNNVEPDEAPISSTTGSPVVAGGRKKRRATPAKTVTPSPKKHRVSPRRK